MNKIVKLLILIFVFTSCNNYVPSKIKNNFEYCYDANTDFSNSRFKRNLKFIQTIPIVIPKIDEETGDLIETIEDTIYAEIFFYKDGLYSKKYYQKFDTYADVSRYKTKILRDLSFDKSPSRSHSDYVYVFSKMEGLYEINDGIIKTISLKDSHWDEWSWHLAEINYKIGDNNELIIISCIDLVENEEYSHPTDSIPAKYSNVNVESDDFFYLKYYDWFWCDEKMYQDWKEWHEGYMNICCPS
jgi:hypothetical protein